MDFETNVAVDGNDNDGKCQELKVDTAECDHNLSGTRVDGKSC